MIQMTTVEFPRIRLLSSDEVPPPNAYSVVAAKKLKEFVHVPDGVTTLEQFLETATFDDIAAQWAYKAAKSDPMFSDSKDA